MKDKIARRQIKALIDHLGLKMEDYNGLDITSIQCESNYGITNRMEALENKNKNENKLFTECHKCGAVYDKSKMTAVKGIGQRYVYVKGFSLQDVIITNYYCPKCKKGKK